MTTNLTPTEIEELRISIAEEMGWRRYDRSYTLRGLPVKCIQWEDKPGHPLPFGDEAVPPYTTSIDAIQEAALERFKTLHDIGWFGRNLSLQTEYLEASYPWQLTALDWCIAFARTSNIWRYKE